MLLRSLVGIALTSSVRENKSLKGKTPVLPFFAKEDVRFGCVAQLFTPLHDSHYIFAIGALKMG
jgi:hypothetical protein